MSFDTYDYIVVGAGTAGSVIAARLTENNDATVLLVEGGGATQPAASANPPEWQTLLRSPADLGGLTTAQAGTGTEIHLARGRGIGGSSTINAMMFLRGHRESYSDWNRFGAKGWAFDDLLPYFKRSETAEPRRPLHSWCRRSTGRGARPPPERDRSRCLTAAIQSGYPQAADISGGLEIGFGTSDLTIINGLRQSAADAYLARAGPTEFPPCHRRRRAAASSSNTGVHRNRVPRRHRPGVTARASVEVMLAAGGIGSPQLLMVSGIGPASHLRRDGVDVVHDLPAVGSNLQDHALTGIIYQASREIPAARNNHGEVMGVLRTAAERRRPDLQ